MDRYNSRSLESDNEEDSLSISSTEWQDVKGRFLHWVPKYGQLWHSLIQSSLSSPRGKKKNPINTVVHDMMDEEVNRLVLKDQTNLGREQPCREGCCKPITNFLPSSLLLVVDDAVLQGDNSKNIQQQENTIDGIDRLTEEVETNIQSNEERRNTNIESQTDHSEYSDSSSGGTIVRFNVSFDTSPIVPMSSTTMNHLPRYDNTTTRPLSIVEYGDFRHKFDNDELSTSINIDKPNSGNYKLYIKNDNEQLQQERDKDKGELYSPSASYINDDDLSSRLDRSFLDVSPLRDRAGAMSQAFPAPNTTGIPNTNTRIPSRTSAQGPCIESDSTNSSSTDEVEWDGTNQQESIIIDVSSTSDNNAAEVVEITRRMERIIVLSSDDDDDDDGEEYDDGEEDEEEEEDESASSEDVSYQAMPIKAITATPQSSSKQGTKMFFRRNRESITQETLASLDKLVFGNMLIPALTLNWSKTLRTTAGVTRLKNCGRSSGNNINRTAVIELSTKVVDDKNRLRSTLLHEMCHAAAWIIDGVSRPPHGKCFRKWAKRASSTSKIPVTTTHNYEIEYKYAWACTTSKCSAIFKRHSRSIDIEKKVCGRCKGKLIEIDVPSSRMKQNAVSYNTPRKRVEPSAYNRFVQEHSKQLRQQLQENENRNGYSVKVSQQQVMKECARLWRIQNEQS